MLFKAISNTVKVLINEVIDLVYPPLCLVCERKLIKLEDQLCNSCLDGFKLLGEPHKEFSVPGQVYLGSAWALFDFDPAFQSLIHHLKYSRRRKPILTVLNHHEKKILGQLNPPYDWVISIPLHPRKQRERGYNQVEGMSRWLAEKLNSQFGDHLVKRIKYTKSQTKLNAQERQENVSKAFAIISADEIRSRRVLLVDDVLTTGATANTLAESLINIGAIGVDLITLSAPS